MRFHSASLQEGFQRLGMQTLLGYHTSIASFLASEPSLPLLNPLSHPHFSYLLSFSFPLKRGNAHRWASWIRMVFLWAFWMFRRKEVELHNPSGSTALIVLCAVLCLVAQSCLTLCNPMDYSPPGSSVHGDSPGKNTEVGSLPLLQGIFPTQNQTQVSCLAGGFFTVWATREAQLSIDKYKNYPTVWKHSFPDNTVASARSSEIYTILEMMNK